MTSRHDSNGPLSPWTDDRSRCITTSPVPCAPQPWAHVEEDHHHARSPRPRKGWMPLVDGGLREAHEFRSRFRVRPLAVEGGR